MMLDSRRPARVAVVIPVYHARYLGDALESVFFQSRPADEIIVVDDGSPDPSVIEEALAPYGAAVTLLRQPNAGAAAARNTGIAATTAPLIAFLDADDRWLPDFLAQQLAAFDRDPQLDLSYTDGVYIGDTPLAGRTFMSTCPSTGAVTLERLLAQECTVLLSAVVVRRDAVLDTGGFDVALRRGQDFDLWLRMARRGARMTYLSRVLTLRREHANNLSGTAINEVERPLSILRKTLETMPLQKHERLIAERRIAQLSGALARERGKEALRTGDVAAARAAFASAVHGVSPWKLLGARMGLALAPQLVTRIYAARATNVLSWAR